MDFKTVFQLRLCVLSVNRTLIHHEYFSLTDISIPKVDGANTLGKNFPFSFEFMNLTWKTHLP